MYNAGIDHYLYGCSFGPAPYRDMRCFVGHGDGYGVIETDKVAAAGSTCVVWILSVTRLLAPCSLVDDVCETALN